MLPEALKNMLYFPDLFSYFPYLIFSRTIMEYSFGVRIRFWSVRCTFEMKISFIKHCKNNFTFYFSKVRVWIARQTEKQNIELSFSCKVSAIVNRPRQQSLKKLAGFILLSVPFFLSEASIRLLFCRVWYNWGVCVLFPINN